ncbi:hypothetical protein AVEN_76556-1 [Araneus ventricosus]|uniref:Uncharacterized protein n=1 Tax=Araneus ventricosus TaxID=182803 RepID=A0A4Y2QV52_ARAVE|nr:hypothetical protein AVEN_76556-1 [Araneus ventricosus]
MKSQQSPPTHKEEGNNQRFVYHPPSIEGEATRDLKKKLISLPPGAPRVCDLYSRQQVASGFSLPGCGYNDDGALRPIITDLVAVYAFRNGVAMWATMPHSCRGNRLFICSLMASAQPGDSLDPV